MPVAVTRPVVQFVSKPIAEPFNDGSKCIVRDLCRNLGAVEPHVLGTRAPLSPGALGGARVHGIHADAGGHGSSLGAQLRVVSFLLLRSRAALWHFVFAPNPRSSRMSGRLSALRRMPTVQTIASPPRSFEHPERLLFGSRVVAQSSWTRARFLDAYAEAGIAAPDIQVIPPAAPQLDRPSDERVAAARSALGIAPGTPLFVYPGDLEISGGARFTLELAKDLAERVRGATVVLTYRDKTPRAQEIALKLQGEASGLPVRFLRNAPDIHALLAAATAIVFPVDDLYGKVDLPIVLLESLALGTPVLALRAGPLVDLAGAELLPPEPRAWLEAMNRLTEPEAARAASAFGQTVARDHFAAARVARLYEAVYASLLPSTAGC